MVVHKLVYKLSSNLSVKYGIFYYVRRVPADLVHHYKSTRISYSLHYPFALEENGNKPN